jgi:chemotaxis signal transduction protein
VNERPSLERQAAALRDAFDRSFALPPAQAPEEHEDLLAIRVAGHPYAIRLRDITGIVDKRTIVSVPAAAPSLLGLAGIRGEIVPVFGLSSILGHAEPAEAPPWMVLCGTDEPIALAFSEAEGYLRLPKAALHATRDPRTAPEYINEIVTTEAGVRPVIGIPVVVAAIHKRSGPQRPAKEH